MSLTIRPLFVVEVAPSAAGAATTNHTITRPFTIVDGTVQSTATDAGATMQILRQPAAGGGYVATTDAAACTPVTTLTGFATLNPATGTFAVGDSLQVAMAGGAAEIGIGHLYAFMTALDGTP